MRDDLSALWFEYEGYGCKEMISLEQDEKESQLYRMMMQAQISEDWKVEIGRTREILRGINRDHRISGYSSGIAYEQLEKRFLALCQKCRSEIEKGGEPVGGTWSSSLVISYKVCAEDCLSGYWSTVIEILLVCIGQTGDESTNTRSELIDRLLDTLVSSQEYALTRICERELIRHLPHSQYARSLMLYVNTITTREPSKAFSQLMYLSRLEEFEKVKPDRELLFLVINQKAYCYAVLGDLAKALEAEAAGLRIASTVFSEYICMLNITRLLLRCGKAELALATLLCAMSEDTLSLDGTNYKILGMLYLSKIAKIINQDAPTTRGQSDKVTINWRVAQAMGTFRNYSNYAHDLSGKDEEYEGIDLGCFAGKILRADLTILDKLGLDRVSRVLKRSKEDRKIGIYRVGIAVTGNMVGFTIWECQSHGSFPCLTS